MKITSITVGEKGANLTCQWEDGFSKILPSRLLRDECPCAPCQLERTNEPNPLALPTFKEIDPRKFQLHDIAPVGNYAIAVRWNDGHATGIYPYELLRKMSEQN